MVEVDGTVHDVDKDCGSCQCLEGSHAKSCPRSLRGWHEQNNPDVHREEPDWYERRLRAIADELRPHAAGVLNCNDRHPNHEQWEDWPHETTQSAFKPGCVRLVVPPRGTPA